MKYVKQYLTGLITMILCVGAAVAADTLPLSDYLSQVRAKNPELQAIDMGIAAMGQKIQELDMVYSPLLNGSYNYTDDRGVAAFGSSLPTNRMTANSINMNASKKFLFGSTVSLGVNCMDATFDLVEPTQIIGPNKLSQFTGYDVKPFARIEQSLLRDFKSGLTLSGINKARSAMASVRYGQVFRKQQLHMKATMTYWALALAREVVSFRQLSLARTEKLLKWNENRVTLDLAEPVDLLQAQAAYKLRQLNLQQALDDTVKASRDANEMLGDSSENIAWNATNILQGATGTAPLDRTGARADVLAARAQFQSSEFAKRETYYRSLPELSVLGTYSLHGIALSSNDAWNQVSNTERPAYTVGLAFVVPLDYKTLNTVKSGYEKDYLSAQETLKKTELAAKNDWDQLQRTLSNVRQRLMLAVQIRDIQEQRVTSEQKRFERGRTTTFQLLQAETDLDDASLIVYRLKYEELATLAQAELYHNSEIIKN